MTRLAKQSAGIQLAPLAKKGTPLTTKCIGAVFVCWTACKVRRPMRLVDRIKRLSTLPQLDLDAVQWLAPMPAGHQSFGSAILNLRSTAALVQLDHLAGDARSWPNERLTSACNAAVLFGPASTSTPSVTWPFCEWFWVMATSSKRAASKATRPIFFQMPQVISVGPQSQPKLQGSLRT